MADLPGQSVGVKDDEWGTMCYAHHDIDATHRICTESDSFGSEYMNLCDVCWNEHLASKEKVKNDESLWETCKCGNREPRMIQYRDYEEGMHGSVYEHCSVCHEKMNARIAEEEKYFSNDDDDWNGGWDEGEDDYDEPEHQPDPHEVNANQLTKLRDILVARGFPFELSENDMVLCLPDLPKYQYKRTLRNLQTFIHKNTGVDGGYWAGFLNKDLDMEVMGYNCQAWLQLKTCKTTDRKKVAKSKLGRDLRSVIAFAKRNRKLDLKSTPHTTPLWSITLDLAEYY